MFDLTGKVAVVTGSTKGIGKSIAENLAALGAKVVISSRKADACEAVAQSILDKGHEATAIPCHIGSKEALEALVADTRKVYGKIDILVCNAATNPVYGPMHTAGDGAYEKIMDTNVKSVFWLCNMVCPEMAERKDGVVIVISSIGGFKGSKNLGLYSLSKAAEQQLVRNLAVEWGAHNIRVNAGPDPDRFCPRTLGGSEKNRGGGTDDPAWAPWRARRHWDPGGQPGDSGRQLPNWPNHHH
jgi:dehydrogenase/reductase SDR family protein 4